MGTLFAFVLTVTVAKTTEGKHRREGAPLGNKCICQQEELILKRVTGINS